MEFILDGEFYRSLFEHGDDGVLLADTAGQILAANPAACRMFGYTEAELKRVGRAGVIDAADPVLTAALDERGRTGRMQAELTFRRADGARFVGEVTSAAFLDANGQGRTAVIVRDVTERRRLQQEREQYFRFFTLSTDPMCIADPFGCFMQVNPAFVQLTGYSDTELVSKPFLDFVVPDDRQRTADEMALQVSTRASLHFENRYACKDGRVVLLSWTAYFDKKDGVTYATARDITELARARQELQDSVREQEAMLDNDLVPMLKVRNSRIGWANRAAHHTFGYEPGALIGQGVRTLYGDDASYELNRAAGSAGVTGAQGFRTEMEMVRRDGSRIVVDTYGALLQAEPRESLWILTDLSPIREAQAQLLQSQKMESVGRLAGGVAHDFNNVLQAILGYAELALHNARAGSELAQDLEAIQSAARRSAGLTNQLLAFARKQVIAPVVLDLNEAVTHTLNLLRRLVPESLALEWSPGTELWPVRIDPTQLDQILTNLVLNARDAITGFGTISLETTNISVKSNEMTGRAGLHTGDYVRLVVRDTGGGMSPATLSHVFEPFFTTKAFGQGNGLGLAIVYGIVNQHEGWVDLASTEGVGTTATIYLPRAETPEDAPRAGATVERTTSSATILLVEDEPAIQAVGRTILTRLGYTVHVASSGEQAVGQLETLRTPIDLLITDVILPGMSGRRLAEQLRTSRPTLPVLFISGYPDEALEREGVLPDGTAFLQKPFTLADLSHHVRLALGTSGA